MENKNTKRKVLLVIMCVAFAYSAIGQDTIKSARNLETNKFNLSIGYGLSISIFDESNKYNSTRASWNGPILLKAIYRTTNRIGIGINFSYETTYIDFSDVVSGWYYSEVKKGVLIRMNYYMGNTEKIDPYFGFGIGYDINLVEENLNFPSKSIETERLNNPIVNLIFGVRMPIYKHLGLYAELGAGQSILQGGLVFSL